MFRKEHRAVFSATQVLAQVEFPVEDFALPTFPGLGHIAPPPVGSHDLALSLPGTLAGYEPRTGARAPEAGLELEAFCFTGA